jgi:hypothetical protein
VKASDLGFNLKTGHHNKNLTGTESAFLTILWVDHVGPENRISADALAACFAEKLSGNEISPEEREALGGHYWKDFPAFLSQIKRDVRRLQNHLLTRHDNIAVLSAAGPGGGYWIAESEKEASEFYDTFRKRGMTGLVKASRGKKAALIDMMQQLSFEFEDLVDKTFDGPVARRVGPPAAIDVVDAFLSKMTANPEQFADGLRKIGAKYGSVLLPKEHVKQLAAKAAELQQLVAGLGV